LPLLKFRKENDQVKPQSSRRTIEGQKGELVKNKSIELWLLVLGLLGALGGWAWTQTVESLSLPPGATVGQTVTATMTNLIAGQDYLLDWSDGTTDPFNPGRGTTQNLSHSYAGAGIFVVILKRVTAAGVEQQVAQSNINIAYPPCNILVTPANTPFGTSTSVQVSGLIASKAWNFDWGDGTIDAFTSSATGDFSGSHTFATTGVYPLKVTTPPLSAGIAGTTICLSSAQVSLPVPTLAVVPMNVNLGKSTTATVGNLVAGVSYNLEWGDGVIDPISGVTTFSAPHTYATASTFTVKLTATGIAPVIASVIVTNPAAILSVAPNPAVVGDVVTASISNLNTAVNYTLDWGDGSSETISGTPNATSQHVYATPATYSLQITATGFVPVISSVTITIPTPTMTVTPSSVTVGQVVTANIGNLASIVAYSLDWGDGSSDVVGGAVNAAPTHVYATNGTFTIKLTTTGIAPVISSVTVTIPTPTLALNPSTANVGQNITANLANLVSSVSYTLDWGDGSSDPISGVVNAASTHVYATNATFTVKLSATGIAPVISSVTVTIPAPNLAIAPNPTEVGREVTATISNLISSVDYSLDWGDGASDPITGVTTFTAKHTFAAAGTFAAKIIATGIAPVTLPVTVSVPIPTLLLESNVLDLGQAAKASLGNLVTSLQYTLDWGDGTLDSITGKTSDTVIHTYAKPGTFLVKLLVTGAAPVIDTITVALPTAVMTLSPNPVNLGQAITAKLTGLASGAQYTLDWGDGSSDPITGVTVAEPKHTYATAGIYVVGLSAPGGVPVIDTVHVEIPLPTLDLSSSNVNPGQAVTAKLGNLLPVVTYTLEWGDNSAGETFSGVSSAAPKHTYATAGNYVVKLTYPSNAPVIQPVTVSVPVAGFDLNPNPALPDQLVTANLNQLLAAVDYSLEWGDGTISTISGQTASSVQHRYSALGQYFVRLIYPGGVTQIKLLTVNLANLNETLAFTGIESANSVITFKMTGLLKSLGYQYTLQFGENNEFEPVTVKVDGTATIKHTYDNAGVKVVKLVLNGIGANNLLRETLTLNLSPALQVSSLKLEFQPQNSTQVNVKKLSLQKVALVIGYTGAGLLEGNWILDNKVLEAASINLNVNNAPGTLNFDIPTGQEGLHTLEFKTIPDPNTPGSVAKLSNRISYNVTPATLPTLLEIGGFTLDIKTITSPLINQFSGTATLDLIVGGALAAENLELNFSGFTVSINGNTAKVFSGQLEKKFNPELQLTTPLALAPQKLLISRLLLTTSGAKLDGAMSILHPSCAKLEVAGINFGSAALEKISKTQPAQNGKYTPGNVANQGATKLAVPEVISSDRFEFNNQTLTADGDLYATGATKTADIKLGCTGVTLKANQNATLDLSDTQSPNVLKAAYGANPTPPDTSAGWMGLFFPTAKLEIKGTLEATATAPVAFSAGGYSFDLILGGANTPATPGRIPNGVIVKTKATYRGWEFTIDTLDLGVTQTEVVSGHALGTTKVPFLIESLKAVFTWQPDANWAIATQGVVKHDFGKTRIYAGAGAFVEQNQNLVLKFANAFWGIGAIATSSSDPHAAIGNVSSAGSGGNLDASANALGVSGGNSVPAGGLYQPVQGQGTGAPVYAPVIGGLLEELTESAVKVDLPGLTISVDGNATLKDGQTWQPLFGGGDLKLLGFAFPITKVGVAREANRYYMGLEGQLEMGRVNDKDPLPTRKSLVRYYVKNGKDDVLIMDKDAYQADVNATTKFNLEANTQTWQISSLGTTTSALLNKKTSSNTLLASKRSARPITNMLAAGGEDFEFADGGTIAIEGMSASVNAAFGLKGGVDYFFVWANVESTNTPLFSLGVMSFYEFHGGVAHHMKWATGKYRKPPTFNKDTTLQIQVGAVLGTPTPDSSTIHLDGTVLVDLSGSVEIFADAWLFTPISKGYGAKAKPNARAYIGISKEKLLLQACVGKSNPPKGGISCNDLKDLNLYGVATFNGWLELLIPFKNTHWHLYIGSYSNNNRITATFFKIYKATGYLMFGYIEGDKPPAAQVGLGFWAGGSVGYDFYKHDEGSAICNWEWHFGFHYIIAADFGIQVTPKFYIDASVSFSAGFTAGAHVCGIGANFEIDIDLYGHIHAPDPTQFDGTAKLYIDLPIIPTFTTKVSVNLTF
jgi:PKD repeat protein